MMIYCLKEIVLLKQRSGHERHLHISPNSFGEIEYVKVKRINLKVKVFMLKDEFVNMVYG